MTDKARRATQDSSDGDPPGGHDPAALEDAKEKTNLSNAPADAPLDPDPPGGHDPAALEDAAKKMGTES